MSNQSNIPGTGVSVVTPAINTRRVSYQLVNGEIQQKILSDGPVTTVNLIATAVPLTPLATVNWNSGNQVRVYYLDGNHTIQELRIVGGVQSPGDIDKIGARAAPSAGLAATVYEGQDNTQIRVYYQELGSGLIRELFRDGGNGWKQGDLNLTGAVADTELAAITYSPDGQIIRNSVFYQSQNLYLKNYIYDGSKWAPGTFNPGPATGRTPLGAFAFGTQNIEFQVYWRNLDGQVVFAKNNGSWSSPVVIPNIGPGYQLSVLQWNNGVNLRIYYQKFDGTLAELCSNDSGANWIPGVDPI